MGFNEMIMGLFEAETATSLIEFGKSLSKIDADVLIFMARKSLCLYDVLVRLGIPPAEQWVVSDRILDMNLRALSGKRVALIDDTLIVGTTLAKTKRQLINDAKASVTVHVFAADDNVWNRDLIQPDSIALLVDHPRLMTFCTAVVQALSLAPRPYLVDFPISLPVRVRTADLPCILSSIEWNSHRISTDFQDRNGVSTFVFFPGKGVTAELEAALGPCFSCLDITKVRAFARRDGDDYWIQFVPLVTLKPLRSSDLEALLEGLLARALSKPGRDRIMSFAQRPSPQFRLVQYLLSEVLGRRFELSMSATAGHTIGIRYDAQETDRHFGPWLHQEMVEADKNLFPELWPQNGPRNPLPMTISPAQLPATVRTYAREALDDRRAPREATDSAVVSDARALFTDFAEVFLALNAKHENPLREEARRLGLRVLDASPKDAPHRDRLKKGIAWPSIARYLAQRHHLGSTRGDPAGWREVNNVLSVVLDLCNDLGITVPLTCDTGGVVFRAYRYGEDVAFSDAELGLAYKAAEGLLKAINKDAIPRLVLQKLLVLLLKVGVAMDFLRPLLQETSAEGRVGIAFALKGPVAVLRGAQDDADCPSWLSIHLVNRGVLRLAPNGQYQLGYDPGGNFTTSRAPDEAYKLGNIIGMLLHSAGDPERAAAPLDDKALTILTTCWPPRHAAAALKKELSIFHHWYQESKGALEAVDWGDQESLNDALAVVVQSQGHEAIHSAQMKFLGYRDKEYQQIYEDCERYLKDVRGNEVASVTWRSYWRSMNTSVHETEEQRLDPWVNRAALLCWEMANCMSALELALRAAGAALADAGPRRPLASAVAKLEEFNARMAGAGLPRPPLVDAVHRSLGGAAAPAAAVFDHQAAFQGALQGIESRLQDVPGLVDTLTRLIAEFGRMHARRDYRYMLWYDIMDSTANKAGKSGADVEAHRGQVTDYEMSANTQLRHLTDAARDDGCEVYCWHGNVRSTNDEKHIFFAGDGALKYVRKVLEMLVVNTAAWPRVRVRIYMVPCGLAGSRVYGQGSNPEVEGKRFLEHWNRLKKRMKPREGKLRQDRSFLLLAKDLIRNFDIPDGVVWENCKNGRVTTEIEMLRLVTDVRYGEVYSSTPLKLFLT